MNYDPENTNFKKKKEKEKQKNPWWFPNIFFKIIHFISYVWVFWLYACMWTTYEPGTCGI